MNNIKDIYRNGGGQPNVNLQINPNNINSYREVINEVKSPHPNINTGDGLQYPNIGNYANSVTNANSVIMAGLNQSQKRGIQVMGKNQQFPPVGAQPKAPVDQSTSASGYTANIIRARQSFSKRTQQNRTTIHYDQNQGQNQMSQSMNKTIDNSDSVNGTSHPSSQTQNIISIRGANPTQTSIESIKANQFQQQASLT